MPNSKKFGTFAGVFTPSILTILGVIMYMRLGWVVGEAGIFGAIGIILVAHIISITTGLSISSIATDKRIKTGGIYYLLSRSLGFAMGGSIGITLFVGTALSIALYLIGFAESFLGIEAIANFLHLEPNINGYRIIGSSVLILLVILAFISTSIAIKSQFIILGAIALSLISIFVGVFNLSDFTAEVPSYSNSGSDISLITIFAIFFPAVTGFTAGVAMSGDLKDSKKAIPRGTLYAIGTGLIVYLALAFVFGYFVDRDLLTNDNNFLLKIAWWSPLVIAGIWGATLSSALGGILGAPRIIQAVAMDKIVPQFLGKGQGVNNEPRNALIFTFILAEMGILIGELNAIAEIVSMFYIAAYGFINLAFALESWASTDFRPSFRVSRWIGILGFTASFGVMFQLNPGAMFAAFVIMWAIYFILKRKELKSETGDVWASVWTSIARTSLTKLQKKEMEERNWKPNILLFSGKDKDRKHQIELGSAFAGKFGFLSIFNLEYTDNKEFLFPKHKQIIDSEASGNKAIFERKHTSNNLYESISQISSTHGFAGMEPNTVFLGWGGNSQNPKDFARLVNRINQLDMNILLMDYDMERKFGKRQRIDIWWRGSGQNGNLSLQLVKFLWSDERWSQAQMRLLIVNPINADQEIIHKTALDVLAQLRIEAEIKVINNEVEQRPFYDILQTESLNTDLIFMGIPEIKEGHEQQFVDDTNKLIQQVGSLFLVKASSFFKSLQIGASIKKDMASMKPSISSTIVDEVAFNKASNPSLKHYFSQLHKDFEEWQNLLIDHVQGLHHLADQSKNQLESEVLKLLMNLSFIQKNTKDLPLKPRFIAAESKALYRINKLFSPHSNEQLYEQFNPSRISLGLLMNGIIAELKKWLMEAPEHIKIKYALDAIEFKPEDNNAIRIYKKRLKRLAKIGFKSTTKKVYINRILNQHLLPILVKDLETLAQKIAAIHYHHLIDIQLFISDLNKQMIIIRNSKEAELGPTLEAKHRTLREALSQLYTQHEKKIHSIETLVNNYIVQCHNKFLSLLENPNPNLWIDKEINLGRQRKQLLSPFQEFPHIVQHNLQLLCNQIYLSNALLTTKTRLQVQSSTLQQNLKEKLDLQLEIPRKALINESIDYLESFNPKKSSLFTPDLLPLTDAHQTEFVKELQERIEKKVKRMVESNVDELEILTENSFNRLTNYPLENSESQKIAFRQMLDYIIQMEYNEEINKILRDLPDEMHRMNTKLCNDIRMIGYAVNEDKENLSDTPENAKEKIPEIQEKLILEVDKPSLLIKDVTLKIDAATTGVIDKLAIYPFIKTAQNIRTYLKQKKSEQKGSIIQRWSKVSLDFVREQYARLLFGQSSGILLTKKLLKTNEEELTTELFLNQYNQTHIRKDVLARLPFYYKHLFLKKQNYSIDFLVGREKELAQAKQYIHNHQNGFSGALAILGNRHSGKSFLANMIADKYFSREDVYIITPPTAGSFQLGALDKAFQQLFDNKLSMKRNLEELDAGKLFIFEDMELWWSREEKGTQLINKINQLIQSFKSKFYFVCTINSQSYKVLNKVSPIEDNFIQRITCNPLNARQIKEMVMKRHQSGSLHFELNGRDESTFHTWHYARLFNQYFKFSEGNAGLCLHAWINNITDIQDDKMQIRNPKGQDSAIFQKLGHIQKLVLLQLIIHNTVDLTRLSRLVQLSKLETNKVVQELIQLGLLMRLNDNIVKTDRISHHRIVQYLENHNYI
jgi:amino acid transporter